MTSDQRSLSTRSNTGPKLTRMYVQLCGFTEDENIMLFAGHFMKLPLNCLSSLIKLAKTRSPMVRQEQSQSDRSKVLHLLF